jgi:hypothetical protein
MLRSAQFRFTSTFASLLSALLLSAPLLLGGCGEASDSWKNVQETSGETWDALKTWSAEKSGEVRTALKKKMDDLEPQLKAARLAAAKGGEKASAELEKSVEDAKDALDALKTATASTWKDAVVGFKSALESLKAKIHELTA